MPHLCETDVENQLAAVVQQKNKNEKLAWQRKLKKMESLIATLQPIEDEILKLFLNKQPIMDSISELRAEMVKECVHPKDMLIHKGAYIECKFCNSNLSIPMNARISESEEASESENV